MQKFSLGDQCFELWIRLLLTRDAIHRARANELRPFGITSRQAAIMLAVKAITGAPTPSEISRYILREPHSVSRLVAAMEKAGLVRKVNDRHRKNLVRIEITEKGDQAYEQSRKRESIYRIMSVLTEEEQQQLYAYLEKLLKKGLEEIGKKVIPFR